MPRALFRQGTDNVFWHHPSPAVKLLGVAPSASTVSRLNQPLTEQYEAWRERSLQTYYRVV